MVDDPDKPGHAKIKAPCPCTKFTENEFLAVDKTDHGFSKQDSKDKDKYTREGIDIKQSEPEPEVIPERTTTEGPPPSTSPHPHSDLQSPDPL